MSDIELKKREFEPFKSFGWKKNLLAIASGFVICLVLDFLTRLVSGVRVISEFDPSIAVLPIIGFFLGIWGIIGALLENLISLFKAFMELEMSLSLSDFRFIVPLVVSILVYCTLPSILWYVIKLPGEKKAPYPRLDNCAHFLKYYLIMLFSVAAYVLLTFFGIDFSLQGVSLLGLAALFSQYLDVVLIVGLPITILVSVIRYRTILINERMVLAFLFIGVIASAIATYLVYRNTLYLDPGLFDGYESVISKNVEQWTQSDMDILTRYSEFWNRFYIVIAIMLNGILIIEMLFMRNIEKKVTKPIVHLADVLERYTGEEGLLNPEIIKDDCRPYRYGYGEVSSLTRTCVNMVSEIDSYTKHIQQVTADKERIGTELNIASKIQRDMLPGIFPPFPDRNEISLFASMTPAKEVGGDFYDFYFIDPDNLVLTIADVSDKGVPASLFMVISKTLIKNHAMNGGSPREILTYVNHQLCQNNTSFMFCTIWLGILNVKTGKLVAANAGHEYPAVRRKNGQFELVMGRHDPPLGIRDGYRFNEYELDLYPGDSLFEYTDGVTEAENKNEEPFGEDRMLMTLNKDPEASPEQLIQNIHNDIRDFVQDAARFDDITMLCVEYLGSAEDKEGVTVLKTFNTQASIDNLDEVIGFLEKELTEAGCDDSDLFTITLAAEEIFVNIANYAYDGKAGDAEIGFSFNEKTGRAEISFKDSGIPFDPTIKPSPDITLQAKDRPIGGLGIYIVKQTMDDVKYEYLGGKNNLTIGKKIRKGTEE